jgi:hypothetical protein
MYGLSYLLAPCGHHLQEAPGPEQETPPSAGTPGGDGPSDRVLAPGPMLAWDSTTVQSELYIVLVSILRSSLAWDAVLLEGFIARPSDLQPHPG